MASYNRGEFFRYSKKELLDYIEQQNEQLTRFESRFRGKWSIGTFNMCLNSYYRISTCTFTCIHRCS